MNRELSVYLDGAYVGSLAQDRHGLTTFIYDEQYRSQPESTPLSLSMPLHTRQHRRRVVEPFLQGLLPDSEGTLQQWAAQFHVSPRNPFALLRHVGADTPGALQVLPTDQPASDAREQGVELERLTDADVAVLLADMSAHPSEWGARHRGRWSLAGTQPKMALFRDDDGWAIPRDSTPTTHIVKPATIAYPNHAVNEYLCMRAAQLMGLAAAASEVVTLAGHEPVFVTRRYDRRRALSGRWQRLHQEDLCQALSVSPAHKYQSDGGPGISQIASLLTSLPISEGRASSALRFFDALVYNVAIGNTDAHAKNYSLLLHGSDVVLAPLYDLGSIAPYPNPRDLLDDAAMTIGNHSRMNQITTSDWMRVAAMLRLPAETAHERLTEIALGAPDAIRTAALDLPLPPQVVSPIADAIIAYTQRFAGLYKARGV